MKLTSQKDVVRKAEARMAKRLARDLQKMGKKIVEYLDGIDATRDYNELTDIIGDQWSSTLWWLKEDIVALFKLGPRYISKAVDNKLDLTKINILAIKYVEGLKYLQNINIPDSIPHTTYERVKEIIADGVLEGSSYQDIAKSMRKQLDAGVFSKARAELIAINTVGNAYENGRHEAVNQIVSQWETVVKYWDTVGDSRVTPECRHNEEVSPIGYNENWPSGDYIAPRYGNPRCRCTTNYEIK